MNTLRQARNEDRGMELFKEEAMVSWANGFKILFNGMIPHTSKTLKSANRKFDALLEKWDMKEFGVDVDMWEEQII